MCASQGFLANVLVTQHTTTVVLLQCKRDNSAASYESAAETSKTRFLIDSSTSVGLNRFEISTETNHNLQPLKFPKTNL